MIKPNSQAGRLLKHLESGKSIDRLTALVELGIFELSARLIDLERAGYKFSKTSKKITNRFGEYARVVEYRLDEAVTA